MTFTTRFAPSPTGPLHLGHAYSALLAHDMARAHNGVFHLRLEDIDRARSRTTWEQAIFEDLSWLGLSWPTPVLRQSDRQPAYDHALAKLRALGVIYPCICTRRDIQSALSAPQEGAHGPDGVIYPGTCRAASHPDGPDTSLRLDLRTALRVLPKVLFFHDEGQGDITVRTDAMIETVGDIVVARRDMGTSYHLSVVVDDAAQQVSHVVRGQDLFDATQIHVVLQHLLALPTPQYHHHRLIRDDAGKRLAKRDDARALSKFRNEGASPQDIRVMVGL
ncbi:MAG: tRNA glutamyl-Q(34) synthetase GluQRS [Sedimentitalea sp.]